MTLRARLTRAKLSRGLTMEDLRRACDLDSRQALGQKLSKRSLEADLLMIRELARKLKVSPAWLAFGIGRKDGK